MTIEEIRGGERLERGGHLAARVADEGEKAEVVGQEQRVGPGHRQREIRRHAMGREHPRLGRRRRQVGVEAEDHVGLGPRPFEDQPCQQGGAIAIPREHEIAGAGGLERRLDRGAGAPVGDEAVVGVNVELRQILRARRDGERGQECGTEGGFHWIVPLMCRRYRSGNEGVNPFPSLRRCYPVQVRRVRACASQPCCQSTPR